MLNFEDFLTHIEKIAVFQNDIWKSPIWHQCFKLYNGYSQLKPNVWFNKIFLKELPLFFPFLVGYPVDVNIEKQKVISVNRKKGIGRGINERDLKIINRKIETAGTRPQDIAINCEDKGSYCQILWLIDTNKLCGAELFLAGIKWKASEMGSVFYEIGFFENLVELRSMAKEDCFFDNFLTMMVGLTRLIDKIVKNSDSQHN